MFRLSILSLLMFSVGAHATSFRMSSNDLVKNFSPYSSGGFIQAPSCVLERSENKILCTNISYDDASEQPFDISLTNEDTVNFLTSDEGDCFEIEGPTAVRLLKELNKSKVNECSVYDFWIGKHRRKS